MGNAYEHQLISDKIITDLSIGYDINKNFNLTIGTNNLFDIYPTKNCSIRIMINLSIPDQHHSLDRTADMCLAS
jgi:outer membrane receptor protein involved in Fe transport